MVIIQDNLDTANAFILDPDATDEEIADQQEKINGWIADKEAKQIEIDAKLVELRTQLYAIGVVKIRMSFNTALTNTTLVSGKITFVVDGNTLQFTVLKDETVDSIATRFAKYINDTQYFDILAVSPVSGWVDIYYYTNLEHSNVVITFTDTDSTGVTTTIVLVENTGIQSQIIDLKNELKIESNFTAAQIIERNQFIIEKEWSDDAYEEAEDLYADGVKKFEDIREPQISASVDIVNFLEVVECQRDWDKLSIGDTIYIYYSRLDIDIEAKIIEIVFDYDSCGINLTIANVKNIDSAEEKLIKLLYKSQGSSTSIDMSKYKWDGVDALDSSINDLIDILQGKIKSDIEINLNNSVSISRRGLIITSIDNPDNMLIAQNGVLAISNDLGNSWKHAITATGLIGDRIKFGIIKFK
jgi:hypothetical protein